MEQQENKCQSEKTTATAGENMLQESRSHAVGPDLRMHTMYALLLLLCPPLGRSSSSQPLSFGKVLSVSCTYDDFPSRPFFRSPNGR